MGLDIRSAGLRTTIAATILAAGVAPLALIFALYLLWFEPRLERETLREHEQLAVETGAVLNRTLFERYSDVQAFVLNTAARDPAAWRTPGRGPLVRALDSHTRLYRMYRLMLVAAPDGEVVAVNSRDARGAPLATVRLYGRDVSREPWFADAVAGRWFEDGVTGPEVVVAEPARVPLVDEVAGGRAYVVPFSAPVRDEKGRVVAVWTNFFDLGAVASIAHDMIQQRRRVELSRGRLQVIDRDDRLVFDSQPDRSGRVDPWVLQVVNSRPPGVAAVSGVRRGEAVAAAPAPGRLGFPGLGWTVITREPAEDAFATIHRARTNVLVALALTALAMTALGLWLGRRVTGPSLRLAARMRALAAGDRSSPIPYLGRSDELGRMAEALAVFQRAAGEKDAAVEQLAARERDSEIARKRLSDLVEGAGDAFGAMDRDWRFTMINSAAERFAGRSRKEALGLRLWEVLPEVQDSELGRRLREVMEDRRPKTFEIPSALQPGHWLEFRVFPTPEGIGVWFRDITERKQADERLRRTEESRRLAMEVADIGAWDFNPGTGELIWDARCKAIFGLGPDAPVTGELWRSAIHPADLARVEAVVRRALDPDGGGLYDEEFRITRFNDGAERWIAARGKAMFEERRAVRFIGTAVDVTERKWAEVHRELLVNELNHRVKNSLATVQAIAAQTLRSEGSDAAARGSLTARLTALARAHDILTRENWESADLAEVIRNVVAPYCVERRDRIRLNGPPVRLPPKAVLALSMAVHELCTNAVKYGALSNDAGRVEVVWRIEDGRLRLTWRERGGPPVFPPTRRGFGSRLLEAGLAAELGGSVELAFEPEGLVCRIDAPLSAAEDVA